MFLTTVAKENSLCQFPLNSRLCQGCGAVAKTSGHFNCPGGCSPRTRVANSAFYSKPVTTDRPRL